MAVVSSWKSWFMSFRPKTLTAAVVPILGGTSLAYFERYEIQWFIPILALLCSVLIQIGTNLINDAMDYKKGADNEERIGPVRVTQSGLIHIRHVFAGAFVVFGLAALLGLPLVLHGGWPIFWIGILSLVAGYSYTGGPFPLAYKGLGDIFVILFFGLVATMGLYYLLTGTWTLSALVLGLQIGFHCTVLIAVNNFRDMYGDIKVGKKTLPVRFGASFARAEILVLLLLPFVMNIYWYLQGATWAAVSGLLVLPLALLLIRRIFTTEPSPAYNRYLGMSAGIHLAFGLLTSVGLALCR